MKKLLTLFTLLLTVCSGGNQALYGIADGTNKPTAQYSKGSYKWGKSRSSYSPNLYVGYKVEIENGYTLSLSHLISLMYVSSDFTYKVVILDKNKNQLFTTSDLTISNYNAKNSANAQIDSLLSDNSNLQNLTDSIFVRAYMYKGSTSKYFCFPKLQLTGTVASVTPATTYDVTYKANGSGEDDVEHNVSTVEDNMFTWAGHTFTGWNTESDGSGDPYAAGDAVTEDLTLWAQWEETTYTVTIAKNNNDYGSVTSASVADVAYNTTISATDNVLSIGTTDVTATPADNTAEYTYAFSNWTGIPDGGKVIDNVTVTANFTRTPVNYTLSWNANGGNELTGDYTSGTVAFGTSITAPNTPTYTGHTFVGWAESADGAVVNVPATMPAANKTYYAQWIEGTAATITYNLTTNTNSTTFNACESATPTSGDVEASTTINTYGTAGAASSGQSSKTDETQKLNIDDSYTAANYYEWTFIENDCTFAPTNVKIKFQSVSDLVQYKVALTDGITSKTTNFVQTTSAAGTLEELDWDITDGTVFAANKTVKLQIWAYKKGDNATAFRLGSPITINGAVKSIPVSVSGTITEAGWNTFSSNYALDLGTITGGAAYVASTKDNTTITLTETSAKVAAGEGLMIKGTAGATFTISTTTDAATLTRPNFLVGLPNGGTVAKNADNYVYAWTSEENSAGFYFVNDFEPTLGAGKAYLHAEGMTPAKLNIIIDDTPSQEETDGIKSVQGSEFMVNGETYNLSGQRVGNDYKGIVIVNGKKYLRK